MTEEDSDQTVGSVGCQPAFCLRSRTHHLQNLGPSHRLDVKVKLLADIRVVSHSQVWKSAEDVRVGARRSSASGGPGKLVSGTVAEEEHGHLLRYWYHIHPARVGFMALPNASSSLQSGCPDAWVYWCVSTPHSPAIPADDWPFSLFGNKLSRLVVVASNELFLIASCTILVELFLFLGVARFV